MRGKRKAAYWDDEFLVSLLTGQILHPISLLATRLQRFSMQARAVR